MDDAWKRIVRQVISGRILFPADREDQHVEAVKIAVGFRNRKALQDAGKQDE